jgi:hypothetical protein
MNAFSAAALTVLLFAKAASGHHSYAMFEVNKTTTLTGTVKTWEWTNPHVWLVVVTRDTHGENVEWQIEGASPSAWRRYGASRDMVKAGDQISVIIHPLRSGANGGQLQSITTASGKIFDLAVAAQP